MLDGVILKGIGGFYYIDTVEGSYECRARGIFRKEGIRPTVGDSVQISVLDEANKKGSLDVILPRRNELIRPRVSNIDQAVIVFAAKSPNMNLDLLDRFLLLAEEQELDIVIVINKIDTVEKPELLAVIAAYSEALPWRAIVPVSAQNGDGLAELFDELAQLAVPGPQLFPDDMISDMPEKQICAELVREKLLLCLDKEIPHGTAVEVTKFSERDNGIIDMDVTIYCEKESHKGIIIGKRGAMLKKIGELARQDIERFMGTKVYLQTWVKVKENWRDSAAQLRNFGFTDQ